MADNWAKAINRPNLEPNNRSFVCSVHFRSSYISETKKGHRILTPDAIPELCIEEATNDSDDEVTSKIAPDSSQDSSLDIQAKMKAEEGPCTSSDDKRPSKSVKRMTHNRNVKLRWLKLKSTFMRLEDIATRRRMRCNALYVQRKRYRNQIALLKSRLAQIEEKEKMINENNKEAELRL